MDVSVSQLDPSRTAHVDLYRSIRLRALTADPDAFGSDIEREAAFTDAEWHERVAGFQSRAGAVLVARLTAALQLPATTSTALGVVGIGASADPDDATLWGMWVAPTARGIGVSTQLLDAADHWSAEQGRRSVTLWVHRANAPAIARYERHGYTTVDAEQLGISAPDGCRDELCMRLTLRTDDAAIPHR